MVNHYTPRTPTPVPPRTGVDCGECGLPGLALRQVRLEGNPALTMPMLVCAFCRSGVQVGRVREARIDTPPSGG